MSRNKAWPVYVAGGGCGHQHATAKAAYNCGKRITPVTKLSRSKPDKSGERVVKTKVMFS